MAVVYITMGKVGKRGNNGVIETFLGGTTRSETITSSGTTAVGSLAATDGDYVQIACASNVAAVAGSAPTATLATGLVAFAGIPNFMAVQTGDKIAVIDV